jgi:hypothetical protein
MCDSAVCQTPFLGHFMWFLLVNLVWWKSGRLHVTGYMIFFLSYTYLCYAETLKFVSPCDPNFGE